MPQMKKVKTAIIGCGTICNRIYAVSYTHLTLPTKA